MVEVPCPIGRSWGSLLYAAHRDEGIWLNLAAKSCKSRNLEG